MSTTRPLISVAVPLYNESAGIAAFHGYIVSYSGLNDLQQKPEEV